jgi:hypothetical protein
VDDKASNYDSAGYLKMTIKRYCVYILQSINFPDRFYTGFSEDLNARQAGRQAVFSFF